KDRFYGVSPLFWAAGKQHWKVVAALIEAGAEGAGDILPGAVAAGEIEVVRVALQKGTISGPLLDRALAAAPEGQTELIQLLETAGATRPDPARTRTHDDSTTTREPTETTQDASRSAPPDDDDSGEVVPQNWPSFRGPQATGIADGQKPPTAW